MAELLCAVVFSAIAVVYQIGAQKHSFDIMLQGRADALLGAVQDAEDPDDNLIVDPTELSLPREDVYLVLMENGHLSGHSAGSPPDALRKLAERKQDGVFEFEANGRSFRALRTPGMRVVDREKHGGIRRPVTILYAAPSQNIWRETFRSVRFYVAVSSLLLAATAIVIVWFLRHTLSPLRELAERASSVSSSSWDFQPPDSVLSTRELEPIAASIQELLLGLREAFEKQQQFTGDAAHELKTSLAVLKSTLQLLVMRDRTPAEYSRGIERTLLEMQLVEELTRRMLRLTTLEQTPAIASNISDLSQIVGAAVGRMQALAALRGIRLDHRQSGALPVSITADDLNDICLNLLLNAVQHSLPGGSIRIVIEEHEDQLSLVIADEGKGIPAYALPHVFERFYRADPSRSRANGGAGLGPAICKAAVDKAGGTISIDSAAGCGTSVRVTLRRLPAEAMALVPADFQI